MRCSNCNDVIPDGEVRWAYDDPYCEDCFDDNYTYCSHCDEVIARNLTIYDDDGEPFCNDCWSNENDDDAPDNPDVSEADRELIVHLSRNWLQGNIDNKKLITINKNDYHLQTIKDKVGLVEKSIYIFGLQDRDEYQISASSNIIEDVKEFVLLNLSGIKVSEGSGCNRLGISLSLRKNNSSEIIKLIKKITVQVKEPVLQ